MHESNRYYGHDAILRAYCGVHPRRQVAGVVQHGWTPVELVDIRRRWLGRLPFFVWSDRVCLETISAGAQRVTTVGAPFVYLLELLGPPPTVERNGVLVLPYHGLAAGDETETATEFLEEVAEREDPEEVLVLLHANELSDPRVQATCRRLGLRTSSFWRDRSSIRDPYMLVRQVEAYRRASKVVSNSVCTPLWYAAHLGAIAAVYGPRSHHPRLPGRSVAVESEVRRRWPHLFTDGADFDPGQTQRAALDELGVDRVLPPEHLAEVLGLGSSVKQVVASVVDSAAGARRRLRPRIGRVRR